jgi:fructokinase
MNETVQTPYDFRLGIDLGGTKIEIVALDGAGGFRHRRRVATPAHYEGTVQAIADLVLEAEQTLGGRGSVGVGIPGVISPASGLVKGANSVALNGHPLDRDLGAKLAREVRVENDANCFALSEASDGAGVGHRTVFGVIVGTGCGGGVVVDGHVIAGRHHIAGEWGHIPLPWPKPDDLPPIPCWCGLSGCMERYISGTGLAIDCDGPAARDASGLPARAAAGDARAQAALARHADRMGRGLAVIVNILDPDIIVLGGGVSNMDHLYAELPKVLQHYVFSDVVTTPVVRNRHGDSSGVRGAAWMWPPPPA